MKLRHARVLKRFVCQASSLKPVLLIQGASSGESETFINIIIIIIIVIIIVLVIVPVPVTVTVIVIIIIVININITILTLHKKVLPILVTKIKTNQVYEFQER